MEHADESIGTRDTDVAEEVTAGAPEIVLSAGEQAAVTLMEEVCEASGLAVKPVVRSAHGGYLNVDLVGLDARDTWGRHGQSLDALQFLCNLIVSHRGHLGVRLILDSDDYRNRRAQSLTSRALELAREVKERNEEAELEPLPAHERRIIHAALVDDTGVSTYSEGDEPARRVIISPRH